MSRAEYFWIQQLLRTDDATPEQSAYASLFRHHHITGKRLLLLEELDLKDMGIISRGHIIHLKTAIEKLTHDYLNLFHFPPLIKDSGGESEENEEKIVNLELVFGYHLKAGTRPEDCKWKMYMEMDGDEIAITYIKEVTFNAGRPDVDVLKMTKPPFVMEKWIVGIADKERVECAVTYESDVKSPKSSKHIHHVHWDKMKVQDAVKSVQLAIQTPQPSPESRQSSRSNSMPQVLRCHHNGGTCNFCKAVKSKSIWDRQGKLAFTVSGSCGRGVDCEWIYTLRMRQMETRESNQSPTGLRHPSRANSLAHIMPYLHDQASYAAALRRTRTPTSYQVTSINYSRSASPTQLLVTRNMSSLQLNSKGSSASSTASDSPSERDRSVGPRSNGYYHSTNSYRTSVDQKSGRGSPHLSPTQRQSGKYYKPFQPLHSTPQSRSYDHRTPKSGQQLPRHIPGMNFKADVDSKDVDKTKVSEDGWIKVEHSKKSHKPASSTKPNKDRAKGTGRGRR